MLPDGAMWHQAVPPLRHVASCGHHYGTQGVVDEAYRLFEELHRGTRLVRWRQCSARRRPDTAWPLPHQVGHALNHADLSRRGRAAAPAGAEQPEAGRARRGPLYRDLSLCLVGPLVRQGPIGPPSTCSAHCWRRSWAGRARFPAVTAFAPLRAGGAGAAVGIGRSEGAEARSRALLDTLPPSHRDTGAAVASGPENGVPLWPLHPWRADGRAPGAAVRTPSPATTRPSRCRHPAIPARPRCSERKRRTAGRWWPKPRGPGGDPAPSVRLSARSPAVPP